MNLKKLKIIMKETTSLTSIVFMILIGATSFSLVFRGLEGDKILIDMITGDIKLEFAAAPPNQTVTIQSIPAGTTLNMLVRKVYTNDSTTTASEMVALY